MDINGLFSAFSLVAVFIYLYIGGYAYTQNKKSRIHRTFLALCTSYAIWSLAYAFAYLSVDNRHFMIWNKISAVGWCSFSAITLYLVLLITEYPLLKIRWLKYLIFLPAFVFLAMAVFLFGDGIQTPPILSNIFYVGDFIYNFSYLLLSILFLLIWGLKSSSKRTKIQARILVVSSIVPFLMNLLTQTFLPLLGDVKLPLMGQLYSLIMVIGAFMVIERYKFMKIPEKVILEEVTNKIMDMVIILNDRAEIIKFSTHTLRILGYAEEELLNKNIRFVLEENVMEGVETRDLLREDHTFHDIHAIKKNGERLPVDVAYIPIIDEKIRDFLGAALVMHDISTIHELRRINEELKQRAIRDSLTELYNHQHSIELIKEHIDRMQQAGDTGNLSILMLDIDLFKKVNDTYGHPFGDYVIQRVSGILMKIVHENGYVGRFGGEEFIVILPDIGEKEAVLYGEKIRTEVADFRFQQGVQITVSIGARQYSGESSVKLVKRCDDLLYKAKQNGRNRVEWN